MEENTAECHHKHDLQGINGHKVKIKLYAYIRVKDTLLWNLQYFDIWFWAEFKCFFFTFTYMYILNQISNHMYLKKKFTQLVDNDLMSVVYISPVLC